MLKTFRTYQQSLHFYQSCQGVRLPAFLKNQLLRASSSISLNLAEGSSRPMGRDRMRFYLIAFGSLRECQAVLDLNPQLACLRAEAFRLGGGLYRLCHPL